MLEKDSLNILIKALQNLEKGFSLPSINTNIENPEILKKILIEISEKLKDNYPYFHPLYAGQMLKPPHPVARLAYMLSMWINPNNHALDGG
ncbi:MAG: aspartate aminotransferase family protein, partial [Candidatus Methanofastidiosa archaeon]|nr:aspartate aminotransferase family protein [Candidatus Methanofastidiosa archaeon]